jgi:hypothetical protein
MPRREESVELEKRTGDLLATVDRARGYPVNLSM